MLCNSAADNDSLEIQNDVLHVSVLTGIGAKLFDIIHRPTGHNFLWHNPRISPQRYPIDANFDNYWCGGWDDGFPTCEACVYNGEQYPNLGELRSVRWRVETRDESNVSPSIALEAFGPISPVRAQKTIRLFESTLEIEFQVSNIGHQPIDFLFGTHPAFAIEPGCVIHIPARSGIVVQANRASLGKPGQQYERPIVRSESISTDMSVVPAPGDLNAGHYVTDLAAGWYAVEYPERRTGILVEFPVELCPYLWLWLSYGGWRGYYVAVIEPWTSCPVTLSEAVAVKTHRTLVPGGVFRCRVRATPWTDPATLDEVLAERQLPKK